MADELLRYYERELTYLRQMGAEFAEKYPKVAGRLLLEADKCEDPHVERLLQAFAFLTARVQHKLDDEFPEISESLLGVLYPHYLAPIPSTAIVQFDLDPAQAKLTSGHLMERETLLYSEPVDGVACRFRTCYPVTLWPVEVAAAQIEPPDRFGSPVKAAAVLRLELATQGDVKFADLELDRLRFFLQGEGAITYPLYELLFNDTVRIELRPSGQSRSRQRVVLPDDALRPVGFDRDEGILPYPGPSFVGYRLLQEYFSCPEKFLFADLCGLGGAAHEEFGDRIDVLFFLDKRPRLEQPVRADHFRLGCTPIVNLFEQVAEPIRVSHATSEYRVIADVRRQHSVEVYSVDAVTSSSPDSEEPLQLAPFYSFKHAAASGEQAFWYTARKPSQRKGDMGTEVYLSLADLEFRPALPPVDTLTIRTTCTNRDLPGKLPFGGSQGSFELDGAAPLSRIHCLTKPTETIRPPQRRGAHWRFISHLTLNYLSLQEAGREALQEVLRLYDFSDSPVVQQHIEGLTRMWTRRVVGRPGAFHWNGFCRGIEVTLEFDAEKYVGSGVFLFASVLERFLALYTSLNSFTQMIALIRQKEEPLKRWPPRAGEEILL